MEYFDNRGAYHVLIETGATTPEYLVERVLGILGIVDAGVLILSE